MDQAVEELLATGITPGAGSRIPSLHIWEIVVDFHHGGPAQQAALADQPEGLQIQGHGEHEQVGGQGGGVAVAGSGCTSNTFTPGRAARAAVG